MTHEWPFSLKSLCSPPLPCARTMADSVHVKDTIDVSNEEEEIFELLLNVLQHSNLDTQLRVAGGWVRDKVPSPFNSSSSPVESLT